MLCFLLLLSLLLPLLPRWTLARPELLFLKSPWTQQPPPQQRRQQRFPQPTLKMVLVPLWLARFVLVS